MSLNPLPQSYRLCEIPDLLLIREIRDGLATQRSVRPKPDFTGRLTPQIYGLKHWPRRAPRKERWLVAEEQTQGKVGATEAGFPHTAGYLCLLILRPSIPPNRAPDDTSVLCRRGRALLALTSLDVEIKWPNDILVNSGKIAGILTEISTGMDTVDYMIVGLGLNVNIPADCFPREIRHQATSILAETGAPFHGLCSCAVT